MKFFYLVLAFCALCAEAGAQTVSVANVEALPGETVSFTLDLTGGKADTYIAMQFDVQFPATGFTTTGNYSVSPSWTNTICIIGDVDANGLASIPVSSAEAISGADVDGLLTVFFKVDEGVAIGEYDVTIQNLWFGYGTNSKDYVDDVTFKVNVVARHTVVLDENSTIAPEAAEDVNVRVKRTIKADEWSTICLPFDMTKAQVEAAFGEFENEDVILADFTGVDAEYEGNNVVSICVNFTDENMEAIQANHPYLIKVKEAVNEFTVDGVDIAPEDEASVDMDENNVKIGGKWYYFYNSFVGTYVANTEVPQNCLFLNNSKFYYSTGATQMKGFRGYFDFYDVLPEIESAASKIRISFDNDFTTINEINMPNVLKGNIYNLNGQLVGKDVNLSDLPKGIYMVNGKKVVNY